MAALLTHKKLPEPTTTKTRKPNNIGPVGYFPAPFFYHIINVYIKYQRLLDLSTFHDITCMSSTFDTHFWGLRL